MTILTLIRNAKSEVIIDQHLPQQASIKLTLEGKEQAFQINNTTDLLILCPTHSCISTYTGSQIKAMKIIVSALFREQHEFHHYYNQLKESEFERRVREAYKWIHSIKGMHSSIVIISHRSFLIKFTEFMFGEGKNFQHGEAISYQLDKETTSA